MSKKAQGVIKGSVDAYFSGDVDTRCLIKDFVLTYMEVQSHRDLACNP